MRSFDPWGDSPHPTRWQLLAEEQFEELVEYLQRRIDATVIGKLNRARGHPNYRIFDVWQREA